MGPFMKMGLTNDTRAVAAAPLAVDMLTKAADSLAVGCISCCWQKTKMGPVFLASLTNDVISDMHLMLLAGNQDWAKKGVKMACHTNDVNSDMDPDRDVVHRQSRWGPS